MFKNYDPTKVVVAFRGILINGYFDGTFIKAERSEDAFSMKVGAGGDVTRVRSRNRSGSVTLTLLSESLTNDALSAAAALDEASGTGTGSLQIKDLNGTTLVHAEIAWVKKLPGVEYAADASSREWVLDCSELKMLVGGNLV